MNPQSRFAFSPELIVDLFAGAGGASEGIRQAFGRDPDIAINHDAVAVSMHEANHPYGGRPEEFIPAAAYRMADAMIAAREQRT